MIAQLTLICFPVYQEITIASNVTLFFRKTCPFFRENEGSVKFYFYFLRLPSLYESRNIYNMPKSSNFADGF